ncbi:MAG: GNAT family N-acetyltransferase [Anaerolineae bacterium]|nr:GNAT family N-acetyltransferase [Anaerolineae bacterium]
MIDVCEFLEWDTRFFGYRIGRANIHQADQTQMEAILNWCDDHQIDCLYFLSHGDHPLTARLLAQNQFQLVDIRTTLSHDKLASWTRFTPELTIRPHQESDIPRLKKIASQSYRDSRFYFDTHFSEAICDQLYETWIEKSCYGYADMVQVCEIDGQPVGFVTCLVKESVGNIGLVGVDSAMRGKGIGYQVLMASLNWFANQPIQTIEVVTQGRNIGAQRLYQRCGFMTKSVHLWYHLWKKDTYLNKKDNS